MTIETAPPTTSLAAISTALHSYAAATDIDGAFEIEKVIPGVYYILGRLSGYLTPYDLARSEFHTDPRLAAKAADLALDRVTVVPVQTSIVNLTLFRGGSLSGTVHFDDAGTASNISIKLYRKDDKGGWQPFTNRSGDSQLDFLFSSQVTDDRGHFYEPALPPGTYTLEAQLPEFAALPASVLNPTSLNIKLSGGNALRVFNGDKYRLNQAAPIDLKESEDRSGIEINLPTSGLHTIHGIISAGTGSQSFDTGNVRLLDPETNELLRETQLNNDGSYTFNYVVTGTYLIEVEALTISDSGAKPHRLPLLKAKILVEHDLPDLAYTLPSSQ